MDSDDMGLAPPANPAESETIPISDMSPVLSFLSGKNCLNGVSLSLTCYLLVIAFINNGTLLNRSLFSTILMLTAHMRFEALTVAASLLLCYLVW